MAVASACVATLLTIPTLFTTLPAYNAPNYSATIPGLPYNLTNIQCPAQAWDSPDGIPPIQVSVNDSMTLARFTRMGHRPCTVTAVPLVPFRYRTHTLHFSVDLGGEVFLHTERAPNSCRVARATPSCNIHVGEWSLTSVDPPNFWIDLDVWLASLKADMEDSIGGWLLCDVLTDVVGNMLIKDTHTPPPAPLPTYNTSDEESLYNNKFFLAIGNIVRTLPSIGGLTIGISIHAPNALHASIVLSGNITIDLGWLFYLYIPPQSVIHTDVVFLGYQCDPPDSDACTATNVSIANLRLTTDGNEYTTETILSDLLTGALQDFINTNVTSKLPSPLNLNAMPTAAMHNHPPVVLMATLYPFLVVASFAVLVYSYRRHKKKHVYDDQGMLVPISRVMLGDFIITATCATVIGMFAWSNSTSAAEMVIGDEVSIFAFSLPNTVSDMWKAGLKPLSFFVCLFSGVYPYIKAIVIVLYSVVWQQPQSRVLRLIDTFGKFSLLDSLIMILMAQGLAIPGIANVRIGWPFYLFLIATVLSIAIGNYATHGYRREIVDEHDIGAWGTIAGATTADYGTAGDTVAPAPAPGRGQLQREGTDLPAGTPAEKYPQLLSPTFSTQSTLPGRATHPHIWHWYVALPCGGAITAGMVLALVYPSLRYNFTGMATFITGESKEYTLWQLCTEAVWPLAVVSLGLCVFVPPLFAFTYPKFRLLGTWCATDALLLCCVCGLLQLEQFVVFILGPSFSPILQIHAQMLWPLFVMGGLLLVQWSLIGAAVLIRE